MTNVTYNRGSPYYNTSQTTNYVGYLDYWGGKTIPATADDTLLVLDNKYHHRADKLSFDLYGTVQLWWVFMIRNPDVIKDPIWDFTSGITIYAPPKSSLVGLL
jgi:hypothetical protein